MRSVLIKQGGEYIIRFDIINTEQENRNYTIRVFVNGKRYDENIFLGIGRSFTYQHHIYAPLQDKKVNVSIYRENEPMPISENIYAVG
jgi:hypothetical protein